jgi:DNA-binding CsgD family transcriptional regulator
MLDRLSPQQKEIVLLIAQAFSDKEIAHELGINRIAVSSELRRIRDKFGLKNRVALALAVDKELRGEYIIPGI